MSEVTFDDLKRIPRDTTDLIVLRIDRPWPVADVAEIAGKLGKMFPSSEANPHRVLVLTGPMSLEVADAETLARLGLKRLDPAEQRWREVNNV